MKKNKRSATADAVVVDANGYIISNSSEEYNPQNSFVPNSIQKNDINNIGDNTGFMDIDAMRNIGNVDPRVDITTNPEIFSNFLPPIENYNGYSQDFLPTDYNSIIKYDYQNNMNYDYNYSSVYPEEEEVEENAYMTAEEYNRKKIKIILLISVSIFYIFFLGVGLFNTNYKDGYAQIINYEIKEERIVYKDVYNKIIEISSNEQFAGKAEINSLNETKRYTEKKIIYNKLINDYQKDIAKYRIKLEEESNLINKGMYSDLLTLLSMQEQLLTKVVSYYSYLNGDISIQATTDLELLENQLISEQAAFAEKYNMIVKNLEVVKKQLKL